MKSKGRATRRRSRRPKFVSLRSQLTQETMKPVADSEMVEKVDQEINVVERFFAGSEGCATTLTGLLQPEKEVEEDTESPISSISVSAGFSDGRSLVKAAMRRSREREEEVRWVRMSEVVSEEVSSRAKTEEDVVETPRESGAGGGGGLALKLDYKEVEEAWCGKGRPFFSWADTSPQTVPDLRLHDDFFCHHDLNATNGVLWGVPDHKSCIQHSIEEIGDQTVEGWRIGQREASVLRYKEKRMNRLFSKRIRYEVRKLNAEKRPRVKGRFVKRS